eukprot:TRINITY_DN73230_c0_g1_i1.p1 TRINITY_DN73230_c0_g1~~TRINITY_DN73230_c0_g1_i1.p1  ORF type:complete len:227 (+),score=50.73 TRINITY_DN73230_c0_g1_i1:62-682(+)
MVIPLPSLPVTSGPPTPEMAAKLYFIKFVVLGLYACAVVQFLGGMLMGGFKDLCIGMCGTFLLKDDPHLSKCYQFMIQTPLEIFGQGGMSCLMPFMFMSGFNGIMGALQASTVVSQADGVFLCFGLHVICYLPLTLVVAAVLQLAGVYFCWQIWKLMQAELGGAPGMTSGGEEPSRGWEMGNMFRSNRPAEAFPGAGHRLGGDAVE